jgi:carboxypeptidase Taq
VDDQFLMQPVATETQLAFTRQILSQMGYDFQYGRQDLSSHPFMISMGSKDVRLTTMVMENDPGFALYSSIHEGGHALYEFGIPSHSPGMPDCTVGSLSLHESQSRLWENNISRSLSFWESQFEKFRAIFPDNLAGKTSIDVFRAYNKVTPSLIRIAADELTYHFHIILRFELENAIINGQLAVADLPEAWNAKIKEYLGLDVPSDTEGVLQDIHWSHGSFGYFPTYSMGSLYAAQFYAAAQRDVPDLDEQFRQGNFGALRTWLSEKIWSHGDQYNAETLCQMATGEPLNVNYFVTYARNKFGAAYGLNT